MNVCCLQGRLASDPEGGQSSGGVSYARFAIALERGSGENKEVCFIDACAFRQTADFVRQYFSKGDGISVVGSLSVRDWVDGDGLKHRKFEVLVNQVSFPVSGRSRKGGGPRNETPHDGRGTAPVGAGPSEYRDY